MVSFENALEHLGEHFEYYKFYIPYKSTTSGDVTLRVDKVSWSLKLPRDIYQIIHEKGEWVRGKKIIEVAKKTGYSEMLRKYLKR